jgi:hypothetical protein
MSSSSTSVKPTTLQPLLPALVSVDVDEEEVGREGCGVCVCEEGILGSGKGGEAEKFRE